MGNIRIKQLTIGLTLGLIFATSVFAQDSMQQQSSESTQVTHRRKHKAAGVIVDRNAESLVVRNEIGSQINVLLTNNTRVQEQKKKIIGADAPQLMSGLFIDVMGRTNSSGYLVAERIRFSK